MSLALILIFSATSIILGLVRHKRWGLWLLMGSSVVAIYWLQSATPIRHLDFFKLFPKSRQPVSLLIILILLLFFVLKTDTGAKTTSIWLRSLTGQSTDLAAKSDLPWLGFSFLAFRLLHVLREFQTRKLPPYSLHEFVIYAIFFPAYTAGPIDRVQRFVGDLRKTYPFSASDARAGGKRLAVGAFKKFVLADSLGSSL